MSEQSDIALRLDQEQRQFDHQTLWGEAADEIRRLRAVLAEARGDRPSGFWSQREWEDWSNELAMLLPEDDVCEYANPDGAQESIITACLTAYVEEREATR